jgi:DNA gyrase subunit A
MAVRFPVSELRSAGRFTTGVRGVNLSEGDYVVGMDALRPGSTILTVSEKGQGKRSAVDDYRRTARGAKGVIDMKITEKTGEIVAAIEVSETDEMMLMTASGQTIRFKVNGVRVIGRNTQGVRLLDLAENDKIVAVSRMGESDEDDDGEPDGDDNTPDTGDDEPESEG